MTLRQVLVLKVVLEVGEVEKQKVLLLILTQHLRHLLVVVEVVQDLLALMALGLMVSL